MASIATVLNENKHLIQRVIEKLEARNLQFSKTVTEKTGFVQIEVTFLDESSCTLRFDFSTDKFFAIRKEDSHVEYPRFSTAVDMISFFELLINEKT